MPTPFSRTLRSLASDGSHLQVVGIFLSVGLLAVWLAWAVAARVSVYEVSADARLEADIAAHPIDAPALGRIVMTRLQLGRAVQAGELLVELDADAQRFQLEEEGSRLAAVGPQLEALAAEAAAEERSLAQQRQASVAALEEARARAREAEAFAQIAAQEAERAGSLHAAGNLADLDLMRSRAEADRRRAGADSLRLAVDRLGGEQQARDSDRLARIESLRREATRLEGLKATAAATVERLRNEIERRRIRAPVAGRIGEVAEMRVGTVVDEAQRLGAIVPPGALRMVAEFLPPSALGRIRPGQKARLRLEGFPWAQYGSLAGTVSSVGSEIRAGRVRVELAVHPNPASPIPLQHGLPGAVEVEVERLAPVSLMLRAAGRLVAGPGSALSSQARTEP